MTERRVLCIGHRGAAAHAPENTLAGLDAGIARGADMIEIDVQESADGVLVLMHDKRVDRTTDGTGLVAELTLDDLRRLDAGGGQRVPTLGEALRHVDGRAGLMIEMITLGSSLRVLDAVRESAFAGPVIYASFLHQEILRIHEADRRVKTLALLEALPVAGAAFAHDAKATHVGIALDSATPAFVDELKSAGLAVFVYTVNDSRDIAEVVGWGVDGIVTDYPDLVVRPR